MAKKGTTGGPRPRRTTEADVQRRREYKSRAEREHLWQRRTLIVTAILIALAVLVLLYGLASENVIQPRQAITTVNGTEISTRDYQSRVRLVRWLTADQIRQVYNLTGGNLDLLGEQGAQQVNNEISNLQRPLLIGSQVLDEMEEDALLAQAAPDLGVTVDQAEVDQRVDQYMASLAGLTLPSEETATPTIEPTVTPTPLVSPTPSSTPAPTATATAAPTEEGAPTQTATPAESATPAPTLEPTATLAPTATLEPTQVMATVQAESDTWFGDVTKAANVDRETIRNLFYYETLRQQIVDALGADVPTEELQVNARHILFAFNPDNPTDPTPPTDEQRAAAQARAQEALDALQAGEPFATLAQAVSDDTGSAASGGELGWASPDNYAPEFKDAVLSADLGAIVGPIETQFGYHIIQVHNREVRPLSATELSNRKNQAYQDWLNELKATANIDRRSDWLDRIPEEPTFNQLLGDLFQTQ